MTTKKASNRYGLIINEKSDNLVNHYIMPLLKINSKTFGFYFVESKLVESLDAIIVTVLKECKTKYWEHDNYQTDFTIGNNTHIVYSILEEFKPDVVLFAEGKYSYMSVKAKETIYKHSGLWYNRRISNVIVTDKRLLALTRNSILKSWMVDEYGLKLGKTSELIKLEHPENIYTNLKL